MTTARTKLFRQGKCPLAYGLHFASGDSIAIDDPFSLEGRSQPRGPSLDDGSPEESCEIHESSWASGNEWTFVGGETSRNADGFVAALRAGELVWLLHLERVEPVVNVSFDGATLRAVSERHPLEFHWSLPIDKPEQVLLRQK